MKVAYISGSYRSKSPNGIYQNIQNAREVALKYWRKGFAVITPHLNTAFMDGACDDHVWLDGDLEILRRCDLIVMMQGWTDSEGAVEERKLAVSRGLEIHYE